MRMRCCRSEPRCKACPIMLHKELRDVRALGVPVADDIPPHLLGLPGCLHKYGPLLEQRLAPQGAAATDRASAA